MSKLLVFAVVESKAEVRSQMGPICAEVDGIRTLPLYVAMMKAVSDIPVFGSGKAVFVHEESKLEPSPFGSNTMSVMLASENWEYATEATRRWQEFATDLMYSAQFRNDERKIRTQALSNHVQLLAIICDLRLSLDPTPISKLFRSIVEFQLVHEDYRTDTNRSQNYTSHAEQLDLVFRRYCDQREDVEHLLARMVRLIASRRVEWANLTQLADLPSNGSRQNGLRVFCSYAHKDEALREALDAHLAMLRREGTITVWNDRKILAGQKWREEIYVQLKEADVVLLLVSADFINSDFCFEDELRQALHRHELGACQVIPIVLRDCDWKRGRFASLQALPKDGRAVTSWTNIDEALANVAKGIGDAVRAVLATRTQ